MVTTRRHLLAAVAPLAAIVPQFGFAAESWLKKKPEDWSAKEVEEILNHSPWSKEVKLEFGASVEGFPGGGGFPGGPPPGGMPGGGGGFPGGGGGFPGGGMPELKVLIRWESALPVRAANRNPVPEVEGGPHYVVSINRMQMNPSQTPGGRGRLGGGADAPADLTQRLLQMSSLQNKGKNPISPVHAEVKDAQADLVTLLYFPKNRPLELSDKEVAFSTQMGPLAVKAKFNLKDMVYQGKLEL
jgi:hypothetical protein